MVAMFQIDDDELYSSGTVKKICHEMVFFSVLLMISEAYRRIVRMRAPGSLLHKYVFICSLVLSWYTVSITLILFNKWVLSAKLEVPSFYTETHMCVKGLLAIAYFVCVRRESLPSVSSWQLLGLSLAGTFASLDIMFSNFSFEIISTSFYTFLKSASLIFVLVFGVITTVEPPSFSIASTVVLVSIGTFLMAYGEENFDSRGMLLVLASEVFAALRWIVTQVIVQERNVDAMTAVLYMSPASTLSLLPIVVCREMNAISNLPDKMWEMGPLRFCAMFAFPGFLSFLLLLLEVQLVVETSSLTLTIFGNLKSLVTIIFAIAVFGDEVSINQWCGMLVAFTGMLGYSHARGEWLASDAVAKLKELLFSDCKGGPEESTRLMP
eukprot:TRINITY_DN27531_c0_g1_i1.p1 TRINITY_DN27531_c0_g1~~TRINITY_DN27531_c0_g1_i1.p1  ORF type:complete len:381 (+),score=62.27 TRINITY_DN27531_c0_g1_i1:70-1212(+)